MPEAGDLPARPATLSAELDRSGGMVAHRAEPTRPHLPGRKIHVRRWQLEDEVVGNTLLQRLLGQLRSPVDRAADAHGSSGPGQHEGAGRRILDLFDQGDSLLGVGENLLVGQLPRDRSQEGPVGQGLGHRHTHVRPARDADGLVRRPEAAEVVHGIHGNGCRDDQAADALLRTGSLDVDRREQSREHLP
jgi:hypothetical protein